LKGVTGEIDLKSITKAINVFNNEMDRQNEISEHLQEAMEEENEEITDVNVDRLIDEIARGAGAGFSGGDENIYEKIARINRERIRKEKERQRIENSILNKN
jgi:uncharacterized protein YggL (DUF469 family)